MNCQDMEKFIHVYLDREFAEADRADFEAHLVECDHCRQLARFEQTFKQQLKTSLAHPSLRLDEREALRKKILGAIDETPPEPASRPIARWAFRLIPAAAAALLLLALMARGPASQHREPTPKATPMALAADSPEIDSQAARSFYAKMLSFPVVPPRFSDGQTRLVATRLARVNAERAAHLVYRRGNRDVNVILSSHRPRLSDRLATRRVGNTLVYLGTRGGQSVASFMHRGVAYTLSAELPLPDLTRLVSDVVRQPPDSPFPDPDAPVDAVPASAPGGP